jgi:UDP-3-O-[3-hydroxymyristoyl] N-acetylglucosamine deacetylase
MVFSELFGRSARQQTLAAPVTVVGRTLHSGVPAAMTLRPAQPDLGICFVRSDRPVRGAMILARWNNVQPGLLCTQLVNARGTGVRVVEHVLAALVACGVDNALIEIDGDELPILDGSAEPLVERIEQAGVVAQPAALQVVVVRAGGSAPGRALRAPAACRPAAPGSRRSCAGTRRRPGGSRQ